MICDLCDKDQQSICEKSFHFIKPINECLMRKAQENREKIEELEKIKAETGELFSYFDSADVLYGIKICRDIIDNRISELKGENE